MIKITHQYIRDIHSSLGGRATTEQLKIAVVSSLEPADRNHFVSVGVDTMILAAMRAKSTSDALPFAQSITGCYVQLSLMDEGEYRFIVRQKVSGSRAYMAQALKYVEHCQAHLGADISDELAAVL